MLKNFSPARTERSIDALPVRAIIAAIAGAAERFANADFPPRVRVTAAIEARTGDSIATIDYALDRLFESITVATITAALLEELGTLAVLDGFAAAAGGERRAVPIGPVTIIASDTTIGVAVVPAIFALCAGCTVLVKDRSDGLTAAFFETLAAEHPVVGEAARASAWSSDDTSRMQDALSGAETVVAFGSNATLRELRSHLQIETRFIGYGHRASIGFVGRETLRDKTLSRRVASGAARDHLLYDAQGCMSLHALYVEGSDAERRSFAQLVAEALGATAIEFPQRELDTTTASAIAAYRSSAAFRAALGQGAVFVAHGEAAHVILDPPREEPPPMLPRILPIYGVAGAADCVDLVRVQGLSLETIAFAGGSEVRETLARGGAVRFARFGEMQAPGLGVYHGGRSRITDYLRWIVDEQ